jgi:hypothetical protein
MGDLERDPLLQAKYDLTLIEQEVARAETEVARARAVHTAKQAVYTAKLAEFTAKEKHVRTLEDVPHDGQGHAWHVDSGISSLSGFLERCACGAIYQGNKYLWAGSGHAQEGGGAAAAAPSAAARLTTGDAGPLSTTLHPGQRKWGFH